ncbi:MAG: PHP-associated domain-containing protein [Candidatus Paceibacterota bacterium]|jgi:hypothetical protein
MKYKTNLHFHSSDDPQDNISYSFKDGLEKARAFGFDVLALTCHHIFVATPEMHRMAKEYGILFIPGVERSIQKKHVVILNPDQEVEHVSTFEDLAEYRRMHPEILVIAPHPYFRGGFSLNKELDEHIELFDAIEYSWFYSKWFNNNKKAERTAKLHNLPFIATSDTHDLRFIDKSYALIEAKEKTIPAIFSAIREKRFTNISSPRKVFRDLGRFGIKLTYRNKVKRIKAAVRKSDVRRMS